jgi:hypothetical protein
LGVVGRGKGGGGCVGFDLPKMYVGKYWGCRRYLPPPQNWNQKGTYFRGGEKRELTEPGTNMIKIRRP